MFPTLNTGDFRRFLPLLVRWSVLGSLVGMLSGTASVVFLASLDWATRTRLANPSLLFLLPLAGLGVGWIYHRFGGAAGQGSHLVIDELHANSTAIPLRMAPMILIGTVITHLFGGSAGREGTALQMGASLADTLRRTLRLPNADRHLMLMAGISGGFSSVFGTPVAGVIFGLEVGSMGRVRYEGLVPCLAAALVGDWLARLLGVSHTAYPQMPLLRVDPVMVLKVTAAGIICGLVSVLFVELTHLIKRVMRARFDWPPLRPVVGGFAVIVLVLILNTQDYLGLGLPLIKQSVNGEGVFVLAFLLKLLFTAVTLGTGFMGGEVTPLFVIGATLGWTLGGFLGIDPSVMASLGFVAVFAGASNTPLACTFMGVELFGGGGTAYLLLICMAAYLASGHRGIYTSQRIGTPKTPGADVQEDESLGAVAERRIRDERSVRVD